MLAVPLLTEVHDVVVEVSVRNEREKLADLEDVVDLRDVNE